MPKLPTADDLGQNLPRYTDITAGYTPRRIENPLSGLGRAGEILMARAEVDAEKKKDDFERNEVNKAKVDYLRGESELRMKYETDPDFQTAPDRMKSELQSLHGGLMNRVPMGKYRDDFDIWGQTNQIQAYERQRNDALGKYRSSEYGRWQQDSQELKAAIAQARKTGDNKGALALGKILQERAEFIASKVPQARDEIERGRAGGWQVEVGKMMFDSTPAEKIVESIGEKGKDVSFEAYESFVVEHLEKSPVKIKDGGGFAKFGINSKAHPEINLDTLTREQASAIYKKDYWDEVGVDAIPNNMKLAVFDAAVNQGATWTKQALAKSGGNLETFMRLRKERYETLAQKPEHKKHLKGWIKRLEKVAEMTPKEDIKDLPFEVQQWKETDPIGFQSAIEGKQREVKAQEAEALKIHNQNVATVESRYDLEIATSYGDLNSLNETLSRVNTDATLNERQRNDIKTKIANKAADQMKKLVSADRGSLFVTQGTALNPKDQDSVNDFNNYYENILTPSLENLEPAQKNATVVNVISKVRTVPDAVKGSIILATRSQNPEEITQAADFLDRMSISNPHMMEEFGDEKSLARLRMINERINSGADPKEAIKIVDNLLLPQNESTVKAVKDELKLLFGKKDIDYWRKQALSQFESWRKFNPNVTDQAVIGGFDGLVAKYQQAYEDNYLITRDEKLAKESAQRVIRGQYSESNVNGFKQVMQFPPENYFTIENEDNDWMREQMIEAAQEIYKGSLNPPTREELENNLRLIVDPRHTPRTAASGTPEYKLIIIRDGVPVDFSFGKRFTFDMDAQRKKMIERAKKNKEFQEMELNLPMGP